MIKEACEKRFKMVKDYDVVKNVLYLYIMDEYNYKESVEISDNIILDFDENNIVVALKILNATETLNVSTAAIMNITKWNMTIVITEDLIDVDIDADTITVMPIKQKKLKKRVSTTTINKINIPSSQTTHYYCPILHRYTTKIGHTHSFFLLTLP